MSLVGSHDSGTASVDGGADSVDTSTGVCAPFPGQFVTDAASYPSAVESVDTAEMAPACGSPNPCTPGQTLFSFFDPSVQHIQSNASPHSVYVVEGLGPFPDCTNFRLTVTLDIRWAGLTSGNMIGFHAQAFLNATGLDLPSRDFVNGYNGRLVCGTASQSGTLIPEDGNYYTRTWLSFEIPADAYENFSGPLPAQWLYFWVIVAGPDYSTGTFDIKNINVSVTTV